MISKVEFCFVILHYQGYEDTINCVNSIKKLELFEESKIIIFDNASPNNSGSKLKDLYKGSAQIEVILNPDNLGFSGGNNIACEYAKKHFQPDYYIITNNDIIFEDKKILVKIREEYKASEFYLMGPDIYNPKEKVHQSPLSKKPPTRMHITKTIILNQIMLGLSPLSNGFIIWYFRYLRKHTKDSKDYDLYQNDVCLMGACIIASRKLLESKERMFYPETRFYYEEYILARYCNKNGIKSIYSPNIKVIHNSGGATKKTHTEELERCKFVIKNTIAAGKIYRRYYNLEGIKND